MKVLNPLKAAFGKGKFSRVKSVTYQQWEDTFAVEFDDGLSFLEPHKTIRKANKISPKAIVERVELDEELRHGFFVHYHNGQVAEVSWAFIRELPPKKQADYRAAEPQPTARGLQIASTLERSLCSKQWRRSESVATLKRNKFRAPQTRNANGVPRRSTGLAHRSYPGMRVEIGRTQRVCGVRVWLT